MFQYSRGGPVLLSQGWPMRARVLAAVIVAWLLVVGAGGLAAGVVLLVRGDQRGVWLIGEGLLAFLWLRFLLGK